MRWRRRRTKVSLSLSLSLVQFIEKLPQPDEDCFKLVVAKVAVTIWPIVNSIKNADCHPVALKHLLQTIKVLLSDWNLIISTNFISKNWLWHSADQLGFILRHCFTVGTFSGNASA